MNYGDILPQAEGSMLFAAIGWNYPTRYADAFDTNLMGAPCEGKSFIHDSGKASLEYDCSAECGRRGTAQSVVSL